MPAVPNANATPPAKPRVLVAIPIFAEVLARLQQVFDVDAPCGTDTAIDWTPQALAERLQGCSGVYVAGTPRIDTALLDACPQLRAVCSMAVGYNNIDVPACTARGVLVSNAPDVL
ncbi:MAG: D-glycerate dehydrogenase, partial [Burkholderiales bacterium PBB5]